jgi:hypothetical protein
LGLFGWLIRTFLGPPDAEPAPEDLVLLGAPGGEAVAGLWRNLLEQRGIHALVKNVSSLAHLRMGDQFEVYVLYRDLAEARSILGLDEVDARATDL